MSEQSQVVPEGAVEAAQQAFSRMRGRQSMPTNQTWDQFTKAMQAALAAALPHLLAANPAQAVGAQVGVPDGWRLVPVVPTTWMVRAMAESSAVDDEGPYLPLMDLINFSGEAKNHTVLRAAYAAMLAAAPEPAAEGVKPCA